ncbi:hypothetical protein M514_00175 [Trichuris suis]|uniref:Uncharacterized protein n=1 Tax=Trichuris suis TaxID=68888 RepID=A0A085MP66_9BILA|nr:hypothetical protein M513_00175 [Trichuris suis]KFD73045.1 hypothetical protein M514_00175 [Trichuris suis]
MRPNRLVILKARTILKEFTKLDNRSAKADSRRPLYLHMTCLHRRPGFQYVPPYRGDKADRHTPKFSIFYREDFFFSAADFGQQVS